MIAVPGMPLLFAISEGAWALAGALSVPCAVFALMGLAGRRRDLPRDLRGIEGIALLVLLFLLAILSGILPLMALGLTPLDAAFESVSAVTSTGLTVAQGTTDWPIAGHVLRGWLQWCGGFAIAVAGVAILAGPHPAAHVIGDAGLNERDLLSSTREHARAVLIVYAAVTLVGIAILVALLPTWWEGVTVALAAVSTGGFTPRPDSLASYTTVAQVATLALCLSTAISLLFYVRLRRGSLRKALQTNAPPVVAATAVGAIAVAVVASLARGAEPYHATLNFVSGITTAGFSVAPLSEEPAILLLLIVGMIVGGGIGSTAGGIKLDRVLALHAAVRVSLNRMRAPARAVLSPSNRGRRLDEVALSGVGAIVACYAASLVAGWLALLSLDLPALPALLEIVSALSTVGLSTGLTGADLPVAAKLTLMVAMLLGRLEFLGLIAVLAPRTWIGERT